MNELLFVVTLIFLTWGIEELVFLLAILGISNRIVVSGTEEE